MQVASSLMAPVAQGLRGLAPPRRLGALYIHQLHAMFYSAAARPQLSEVETGPNTDNPDHRRRLLEMQQNTSSSFSSFLSPATTLSPLSWRDIITNTTIPANTITKTAPLPTSSSLSLSAPPRPPLPIISGDHMLTDSFGRKHTYLRISLTERCNLRCLYCMPEDGIDLTPRSNLLSTAEITRLASLFASSGVTKIRLTGGEPTLRPDLTDIVASVASLPGIQHVGLTTNGLTLAKHLPELKAAGLNLLNISLDTLKPGRFEEMTRRKGHDRVLKSIYTAIELGYNPVKLNVVVMSGVNDDEISDFVRLTKDLPVNVRFIEYMPFDGNVWKRRKMVGYKEMRQCIEDYLIHGDSNSHSNNGGATSDDTSPSSPSPPHSPDLHFKKNHTTLERLIDPVGEVAKNFQIPGHAGTISFITSMTSAFCSDCNRVRIMADGNLKVCLFGANEVSLRDAMREGASDEQLRQVISVAVDKKRAAHAGMFELAKAKNRAMIKIGG